MDAARKFIDAHYPAAGRLIADVIDSNTRRAVKTRRNWWDALAGGTDGKPVTVAGREFPVLEVAQRRQHKPVTSNAVRPSPGEPHPPGFRPGKWAVNRRKVRKATKAVKKKPSSKKR